MTGNSSGISEVVARLDAAAARRDTPCGDGVMVWRQWGEGRPLVLLHGAFGSWTHWLRVIPALAQRFRVVVPDLPGYGESAVPPPPASPHTVADMVATGLDMVVPGAGDIELAGFSFGGIVAGLVAARPAARVRTLVLLGPNAMALRRGAVGPLRAVQPGMTADEVRAAHRENLRLVMLADPHAADDLAVDLQVHNVRRARLRTTGIPESDLLLKALPAVRARLAGIWGSRDAFVGPYLEDRRRTLAAIRPDVDFRLVEGAGHWTPYEAPDAVVAALVDILDGPRRR